MGSLQNAVSSSLIMDWHSTPNQTGGSGDQFEIDLSFISVVSEMGGDTSSPHSNSLPSSLSNEESNLFMAAAYNSGEQLPTESFLQHMLTLCLAWRLQITHALKGHCTARAGR